MPIESSFRLNSNGAFSHAEQPALACCGVTVTLGGHLVLRGVDLELKNAELGVIFGRSASGKTTLLRCITGYLKPASGNIKVSRAPSSRLIGWESSWEEDIPSASLIELWRKLNIRRRNVGSGVLYTVPTETAMMFADDSNLLQQLTSEENLLLALTPICKNNHLRKELVTVILGLVGLLKVRHQVPAELSSGQKRRLSLAQCMIRNPRFIALDEPTSALDTSTKFDILHLIQNLHRSIGLTGLLVTHDVDTVLMLADVVFYLDEGRIVSTERVAIPRPRQLQQLDRQDFINLRQNLLSFLENARDMK